MSAPLLKRLYCEWLDPFDDTRLCTSDWSYEKRRSANGYYTREIKRLTQGYKSVFSDILEGRTPKTKIHIYEYAP